jgi:hypothetical protein
VTLPKHESSSSIKSGILTQRRSYGNIMALETNAGRVLSAANSKL